MQNLSKSELRKKYRQIRSSLSSEYRKNASAKIAALSLDVIRKSSCNSVFIFVNTGSEVETLPLIEELLQLNIKTAVPYCLDTPHDMEFIQISSLNELMVGKYGILEPIYSDKKITFPTRKSIIFVPGLAYDKRGARVGYGGGYYDKYMSQLECMKIGLCFREQISEENINVNSNDILLDKIISNGGIIKCQA